MREQSSPHFPSQVSSKTEGIRRGVHPSLPLPQQSLDSAERELGGRDRPFSHLLHSQATGGPWTTQSRHSTSLAFICFVDSKDKL